MAVYFFPCDTTKSLALCLELYSQLWFICTWCNHVQGVHHALQDICWEVINTFYTQCNTVWSEFSFYSLTMQIDWAKRLSEPLPGPESSFRGVTTIVDGFPCPIFQPSQNQQLYYSGLYYQKYFVNLCRQREMSYSQIPYWCLYCNWQDCFFVWTLSRS